MIFDCNSSVGKNFGSFISYSFLYTYKSIVDNIIKTNRHLFILRLANEQELSAITGEIWTKETKDEVSNFRLISIVIKDPRTVGVHLLGTGRGRRTRITSQIIVLDLERGYVATQSGSLYKLKSPPIHDAPDKNDLIFLCVALNGWGLGQQMGVPPFFFERRPINCLKKGNLKIGGRNIAIYQIALAMGVIPMTMPNERTRALIWAGDFLREVRSSNSVPENLKVEAHRILRHYPETHEIQDTAKVLERGWHIAWLGVVDHS